MTRDGVDDDAAAEARIAAAWRRDADAWATVVAEARIESRRLVTDRAIVDCLCALAPRCLLDLGCGEGWLARALAATGVDVHGVDIAPGLVERARAAGGARYSLMPYEDVANDALGERFDACVCNFSLLGARSTAALVAAMPRLLSPGGAFVVQTLHPHVACGDQPYRDGWRAGSWAGIDGDFGEPAPWYFRTLESWVALVIEAGLELAAVHEPRHPLTMRPASLILVARRSMA